MAIDYDVSRTTEPAEAGETTLDELAGRSRTDTTTAVMDVDDGDTNDVIDLPDADLSGEELTVRVIPKQANEFTCSSCFLVHHYSRLAEDRDGRMICTDCA